MRRREWVGVFVLISTVPFVAGMGHSAEAKPAWQIEWEKTLEAARKEGKVVKIFVNWLLSREGQEAYGEAMKASTRRVDVDTHWLVDHGVRAAKDFLTLEEYHRVRNHLEDKYTKVRVPAAKFAEEILK